MATDQPPRHYRIWTLKQGDDDDDSYDLYLSARKSDFEELKGANFHILAISALLVPYDISITGSLSIVGLPLILRTNQKAPPPQPPKIFEPHEYCLPNDLESTRQSTRQLVSHTTLATNDQAIQQIAQKLVDITSRLTDALKSDPHQPLSNDDIRSRIKPIMQAASV